MQNDDTNNYCIFCNFSFKISEADKPVLDRERYETDLGFSNPNSDYIGPQPVKNNYKRDTLQDVSPAVYPMGNNQDESNQIKAYFEETYPDQTKATTFNTKYGPLRRKSSIQRKLLICLPVIGVLIIVVAMIFPGLPLIHKSLEYLPTPGNAITVFQDHNQCYVFNTKGDLLHQVDNKGFVLFNTDSTAAIFHDVERPYYVSAEHLLTLKNAVNQYQISDNGQYIIYTTHFGTDYYLYLYDVKRDKEERILSSKDSVISNLYVMNDGKTVSYIAVPSKDFEANESYVMKIGEEPVLIGKNIIVHAMSENAEYIYYSEIILNEDIGPFYVRYRGKDTKLMDEMTQPYHFNRDYTEVLVSDGSGTYLSTKGYEPIKITEDMISKVIIPKYSYSSNRMKLGGILCNIDSFRNKVCLFTGGFLRLIDDQYQPVEINEIDQEGTVDFCMISDDGNELIYRTVNSNVIRVKNLKGKLTKETILENVSKVAASNDLKKIYYMKNNVLFYMDSKGKTKEIIDDDVSRLILNNSGDIAFFLRRNPDGAAPLYYSIDGGEALPVIGCEEVLELREWNQGIVINMKVDGVITSFYNYEGTKFHKLLNGNNVLGNKIISYN
jgi:hypothetical protein